MSRQNFRNNVHTVLYNSDKILQHVEIPTQGNLTSQRNLSNLGNATEEMACYLNEGFQIVEFTN